MTARQMLATVALPLLAAGVVASTARAVPPCSRKNCMEEILACEAAAGCDDLSGAAKGACRKQCLQQVLAACEADDTLCVPTTTSTTSTTLPCTPGTRPCGSCLDGICIVDAEGEVVCIGGPCRSVGCTASTQCQSGEVCDGSTGACCHPCP